MDDELHHLDTELRAIQLYANEAPRLQPIRLGIDKMFLRAHQWASTSAPAPIARPPSPPRRAAIFPLPKPMEGDRQTSPLGGLFEFPELIPHVLEWFEHPRDLAVLCRVSKGFNGVARKKLYQNIWVRPWEENCHFKLVLLLETLSNNAELCKLVRKLDVRFFPLATRGGERYTLDDQVERAFSYMTNLEHLVWTRDKSLTPALVERMSELPGLRSLEISGHSYRYYDAKLLGSMPHLEDLRVMMPDSAFRDVLVDVVKRLDARRTGGLRGLGIICRTSPLIDDAMLKAMAPHLRQLRRLTLWGCTRVTKAGVFALLQESENLEELSIDALPHSGLLDMSQAPEMPFLHTYSLSISAPHRTPLLLTTDDLPLLPPAPHLTTLLLTLSGSRAHLPYGGVPHLVSQADWSQIARLSLINLVVSAPQLDSILHASPGMEELYISVNGKTTLFDSESLRCTGSGASEASEARARQGATGATGGKVESGTTGLRILHVNAPEKWGPTPDDLAELAKGIETLREVGSGNRVYEVHRREGGEVELSRWSRTWTPGYFQVWRG